MGQVHLPEARGTLRPTVRAIVKPLDIPQIDEHSAAWGLETLVEDGFQLSDSGRGELLILFQLIQQAADIVGIRFVIGGRLGQLLHPGRVPQADPFRIESGGLHLK